MKQTTNGAKPRAKPPPIPSYPRCPACLGAAVALPGECRHCPKCFPACRIDCMHCGGSFEAFPGGGWLVITVRSISL